MEKIIEEFELGEHPYIELCNLLKIMGLCETGGIAKITIAEGLVKVDGKVETRKTCKIKSAQVVSFENTIVKVV